MNPIKYSELIQNDNQGFKVLLNALTEANKSLDALMSNARANADTLKKALCEANPANLVGQETIARLSKEIDELNKRIKELEARLKENKQTQKELTDLEREATRARLEHKQAVADFNRSVKANIMSEEEEAEIMQKATDATKLQELSINQLHFARLRLEQSYRSMKGTMDADRVARQQHAAIIKQLYEQENRLNEAIGKHQMSVGNYAKSWNGLNIAMQQIARETPNMAMGFNTFMLAISNNIPILADQIEIAKKKYDNDMKQIAALEKLGGHEKDIADIRKSAIPVGKQMLDVFKGWQFWLVMGVTAMTLWGDKLFEMLKNLLKTKKGIDDATDALERYNKALSESSKPAAEATAKLNTLYSVATDLNASMEDRIGAVEDLKELYPDVFEGLETEAILAGNAKEQYDSLAESIYKTAMAEAAYSQLAKVASTEVEAKLKKQELNRKAFEQGFLGIADMELSYGTTRTIEGGDGSEQEVYALTKDQRKLVEDFRDVSKTLEDVAKERKSIEDMMKNNDLFGFLKSKNKGGSGGTEDSVDDYYWEAMNAIVGGMNEGLAKELAELESAYGKQKESFADKQKELEELMKSSDAKIAKEASTQMKNLQVLMAATEQNYLNDKDRLIRTMLEGYANDIVEPDIKKNIETTLKAEKIAWDASLYALYEEMQITQEELNAKLAENNIAYWSKYIDMLGKEGFLNPEDYANAMSHIVQNGGSSSKSTTGSMSQRYKKRSWTSKLLGKAVGVVLNPNSEEYDQNQVNEFELYEQNLRKIMGKAVDYINDVIDAYVELKQAAVDAAQAQVDAAQKVYEAELGAYENGYANNVEYARKELALRKEQLAQAQAEQKKAQQIQNAISATMQAASLAEAIANIFASSTKLANPLVAIPVAIAATTAMMAAFATSKAMASKKASVEYGEGMHEYLDYGGSHASGNDLDFGVGKDGRRRRVERGEMIAVFNKRNTDRYGAEMLGNLVDSINHGTFESDYLGVFGGAKSGSGVIVMNSFPSSVSSDISAIRKSTENQRYSAGNGTIVEKYRNRTRIIHLN